MRDIKSLTTGSEKWDLSVPQKAMVKKHYTDSILLAGSRQSSVSKSRIVADS